MRRRLFAAFACGLLLACGAGRDAPATSPSAPEVREELADSKDPNELARWLLAELLSEGGDAKQAARARERLDAVGGGGMIASLARGLDDTLHGRLDRAPDHYLESVAAARRSESPEAPLVAWFAAEQAAKLRHGAPGLDERWGAFVEQALKAPGAIGWRARAELVDLWQQWAWSDARADVLDRAAALHGCVEAVRLAGPFGRNLARASTQHFPAERPGPWPAKFEGEARASVHEVEREGCFVSASDEPPEGIYYAESYFELERPTDVLIAVQGAYAIWVDDHLVLQRDIRTFGAWPRFGTRVRLGPGRHRLLARIGDSRTSVRLMHPDGRPLAVRTSDDPSAPYVLARPEVLPGANVLDAYLVDGTVRDPGDDLLRFLAAILAQIESQPDAANVLLEPLLVRPERATGPVLAAAALFSRADPVYSDTQRRDLVRELEERAVARDPRLWEPRLLLAMQRGAQRGLVEAVGELEQLAREFPAVPGILRELIDVYTELGWGPERARAALELARRFPEDPGALEPALGVLEASGRAAEADALVERIQKLDPDREIRLSRALERRDYDEALVELRRLAARRPERKDLAARIADVLVQAGNERETRKQLEAALAKDPRSERARLDLADAGLASGERDALVRAVLDAVEDGAPVRMLEEALDLVAGVSELEPYRLSARAVIDEYERSGVELPGTAARILDYAVVWVHGDGSSRLLEHQIIRVQSAEAIADMAEQHVGNGILLHMRVIKKDGRILEPEPVEGKPTLTLPHLEVGDYIETERIESFASDGAPGERYLGPRWYFREENIAYARSEFVIISPKNQELSIEARNDVPPPVIEERGGLVIRRYRVDHSPAAPVEPFGAPIAEFLPSVQVGWGVSLERTVEAMADAAFDPTPNDPRVVRVAESIVRGVPESERAERARRLYRWLVDNVEEGSENDGRRVVLGRNGNLWRGYIALCRALSIPVSYAVAQSRLSLPPTGPFSEATLYSMPLLRVGTEKGPVWLTLGGKHLPFGYVPAEARGMPGRAFVGDTVERVVIPADGAVDRVVYRADLRLDPDGSAEVELEHVLYGRYAAGLRGALSEMSEQRLRDVIESRLVGHALRGARLLSHSVLNLDVPEKPLVVRTRSHVPAFAHVAGGVLLVPPPFAPRIGQLATLPERHTPLLLVESTHQEIQVRITLPPGAQVQGKLAREELRDGERQVVIGDRVEGGRLVLDRRVLLPAGRIQTGAYPEFHAFARRADEALSATVRVRLSGGNATARHSSERY